MLCEHNKKSVLDDVTIDHLSDWSVSRKKKKVETSYSDKAQKRKVFSEEGGVAYGKMWSRGEG